MDKTSSTQHLATSFESEKVAHEIHITEENFFFDDGGVIIRKAEFLDHIYSLNDEEVLAFEALFHRMNQNGRIDSTPYLRNDGKGRNYVNCSYSLPRGNHYFPVILNFKLFQMLEIYRHGVFVIKTSLEALYDKALE